jgi:hypothetical protein
MDNIRHQPNVVADLWEDRAKVQRIWDDLSDQPDAAAVIVGNGDSAIEEIIHAHARGFTGFLAHIGSDDKMQHVDHITSFINNPAVALNFTDAVNTMDYHPIHARVEGSAPLEHDQSMLHLDKDVASARPYDAVFAATGYTNRTPLIRQGEEAGLLHYSGGTVKAKYESISLSPIASGKAHSFYPKAQDWTNTYHWAGRAVSR